MHKITGGARTMEKLKLAMDALAGVLTVGSIMQILPPLAAIFSIIWLSFQIYDRLKYGPRRRD
jgi:hypothetical protein